MKRNLKNSFIRATNFFVKNIFYLGFSLLILAQLLSSCKREKAVPFNSCENISGVKYSNEIKPILSRSCAVPSCHVATGYKDLSSYDSLKKDIQKLGDSLFLARIRIGSGNMPLPPYNTSNPLSQCDYKRIELWIKEGMVNN